MGKMGKFKCKGLKDFQKELEKLQAPDEFVEDCAKELAARLLRMVIKRTPVGEYDAPVSFKTADGKEVSFTPHTGKVGGTLRRGWTTQAAWSGSEGLRTRGAAQFVDTLSVHHFGDTYVIGIVNGTDYASYVEYGHRTPDHAGWVKGHFMMTISEQELERIAPQVLERKIKKYLEGIIK